MFLRNLEAVITGKPLSDRTILFEDNKGAKKWTQDAANHSRTKHIDICFHSIREQVSELKNLAIKYCRTAQMLGDPFWFGRIDR